MNIAFLGVGAMGARMASNLIAAGHSLWVWNRSDARVRPLVERGAAPSVSPRDAASQAHIVIAMLTDDDASRAVWLDEETGAVQGLRHGAVAIECSTLSLDWCRNLAGHIRGVNADFLDAPVVGSRPQVEMRQLIHLVGGDMATLEQVRPVLEVSAAGIRHVGGTGSGMAMKLAVNALFGIQVAALGELLGFIRNCGIDVQFAAKLLGDLPVTSPAAKAAATAIASASYAPSFPLALARKDFGYVVATAESHGAKLPTTAFVRDVFAKAIHCGYGDENINAIAKLFINQDTL
jgi:3-hydroxyisobutyrate dehydrogenase-like beta-hydroxyacid dehydrogenase